MPTREEHIREAERIARENPKWWTWDGERLNWHGGYHYVALNASGTTWTATHRFSGTLYNGRTCRIIRFRSPAAAIRALGFTINEGGEHG